VQKAVFVLDAEDAFVAAKIDPSEARDMIRTHMGTYLACASHVHEMGSFAATACTVIPGAYVDDLSPSCEGPHTNNWRNRGIFSVA
jgi:hypothetical protein